MSSKSIDLSEKIDAVTSEILTHAHDAANSLGIEFFVVGATARDFILHHVHHIRPRRATLDIDLGIQVGGWSQYLRLRQALLDTGRFTESAEAQRIVHSSSVPLDIVPFGEIATEESLIGWPPDSAIVMNVLGFPEAFENARTVRLSSSPPVEIAVATPVGLAVLKLIAWSDAPFNLRDKHATDLTYILRYYLDLGNDDRVRDHEDLMLDFDYELTGARLLGRDLAAIALPRTFDRMIRILEAETSSRGTLPSAMSPASISLAPERCLLLLEALKRGLEEGRAE